MKNVCVIAFSIMKYNLYTYIWHICFRFYADTIYLLVLLVVHSDRAKRVDIAQNYWRSIWPVSEDHIMTRCRAYDMCPFICRAAPTNTI